jgi:hypothetical protein
MFVKFRGIRGSSPDNLEPAQALEIKIGNPRRPLSFSPADAPCYHAQAKACTLNSCAILLQLRKRNVN